MFDRHKRTCRIDCRIIRRGIPYITNPLGSGVIHLDTVRLTLTFGPHTIVVWSDILLSWIVWTMNIVGWSAGVDGQCRDLS